MLSTPQHGWTTLTIGNWSAPCSDLCNAPVLLLKAMEAMLERDPSTLRHNPRTQAVHLTAEDYDYILVFDESETHIITETDDGFALKTVSVRPEVLAAELVGDIQRDLDAWSRWDLPFTLLKDVSCIGSVLSRMCSYIEIALEDLAREQR